MPFCVPSAHLEPILKPQVGHVALLSPHWVPSVWAQGLQVQFNISLNKIWSFPAGSNGKESACSAGDADSTPGSEISPGEGNGNPLLYSCLENSMDKGARRATDHRVSKSETRLSN